MALFFNVLFVASLSSAGLVQSQTTDGDSHALSFMSDGGADDVKTHFSLPLLPSRSENPKSVDTYYCDIAVGGQNLSLLLDTGSADSWIISAPSVRPSSFNLSGSPTFQWSPDNLTLKMDYIDNSSLTSRVGLDTITIGSLQIPQQEIGVPSLPELNIANGWLDDPNWAGLLALGFPEASNTSPRPIKTFLENLVPRLAEPVFSVHLPEGNKQGSFEFGAIDTAKFKGDNVTYLTVDTSLGVWMVNATGFTVTTEKGAVSYRNFTYHTYCDTGSNVLSIFPFAAKAYYEQVPHSHFVKGSYGDRDPGAYAVPNNAVLPDFSLDLSSPIPEEGVHRVTIPGRFLHNQLPYNATYKWGRIQPTLGTQNIGTSFFHAYYTVFDYGLPDVDARFGFAPIK